MSTHELRLVLSERLDRRDSLSGAWWPHSTHIAEELPQLLRAAGTRFRAIFGLALNRDEWPSAEVAIDPASAFRTKVSWYGLTQRNLAVLHVDGPRRVNLLIVPPETPEEVAVRAMLLASTPGNSLTTEQVLIEAGAVVSDRRR